MHCYFHLTNIFSIIANRNIQYNIQICQRPLMSVSHSEDLAIGRLQETWNLDDENKSDIKQNGETPYGILMEKQYYLNLKKSEILVSKLKVWSLLDKDTEISSFHRRQEDYFISQEGNLNNNIVIV